MSTRYTNAVQNNTFEPPFTFKKEDGTEGIAIPPHVSFFSLHQILRPALLTVSSKFAGIEKDEIIPREYLEKMDHWQHALESSVQWETGDVLVIDVSLHLLLQSIREMLTGV